MRGSGQSVWIVIAGEYSDARPLAAFSSEAAADAYVERQQAHEASKRWREALYVQRVDLDPAWEARDL
jgi:hypothetical protein